MLVAVRELDVRVREGSGRLLELLEADDGCGLGAVGRPGVVSDELAANAERERQRKVRGRGKKSARPSLIGKVGRNIRAQHLARLPVQTKQIR